MKHTQKIIEGIRPMLTTAEVAKLLHKNPLAVQRLAKRNRLPGAQQVGRQWYFQRNEIQRFVEGL